MFFHLDFMKKNIFYKIISKLNEEIKLDIPKLNRKDIIVMINDEICEYNNYFIPKKSGTYKVKIFVNYIVEDCTAFFCYCEDISDIDFSSFDTKNVTNMSYMFYDCSRLKNLDLPSFDTKNVTDMSYMFYECYNYMNLDLSSFDTTNVTNMSYMFYGCYNFMNLDLSSFDF